jgi:hypothetical protein
MLGKVKGDRVTVREIMIKDISHSKTKKNAIPPNTERLGGVVSA